MEAAVARGVHIVPRRGYPIHLDDTTGVQRASLWELARLRRVVRVCVASIDGTPQSAPALLSLLVAAINAARSDRALPPVPLRSLSPEMIPATLPIETWLHGSAEELELYAAAVIDQWPPWLQEDWRVRGMELARRLDEPAR